MPRCANCPFKDRPIVEPLFFEEQHDVIFFGESPGYEEHREGRPFTGMSGQLLDYSRNEAELPVAGLTNASLCTPPNEDWAKSAAVRACREERWNELLFYKPKVVITLGAYAAESVIEDGKGITRRVGEKHYKDGVLVLLNTHPAYLLRGGYQDYTTYFQGLRLARRVLDGEAPVSMDVPFEEAHTREEAILLLKELQERVDRGERLSYDSETSGYEPYHVKYNWDKGEFIHDRIILMIFGARDKSYLLHEKAFWDAYREVKEFFEQPNLSLIMHVSSFDAAFLRAINIFVPDFDDSYLEHYTVDERKYTHGLKVLARIRLGADDWESDIKQFLPSPKKSSYELIPKSNLAKYGSYDGVFTVKVHEDVRKDMEKDEEWVYENLLRPGQKMFLDLTARGIKIDLKRLLEVDDAIVPKMQALESEMREMVGDPLFRVTPQKCAHYIYDVLKLQPTGQREGFRTGKTNDNSRSTDRDTLLELPSHPFLEKLLEYRELQHDRSNYTMGMIPMLDEYDRHHFELDLAGTVTGRLAGRMLTVKRPPKPEEREDWNDIRSIFTADEGYVLFEADQSQFELRVYSVVANVPEMRSIFASGEDIHKFTDQLLNLNNRIQAKAMNFGVIYGLSLRSVADRLGLDMNKPDERATAEYVYNTLNSKLPGVKAYEARQMEEVKTTGQLRAPLGRKRRYPLLTDQAWSKIRNEALNFPIQSTASDANLLSMLALWPREEELGINLFWPVHDSIIGQVRKDKVETSLPEVARVMLSTPSQRMGEEFGECAYQVEMKVGPNWGNTKEIFTMSTLDL